MSFFFFASNIPKRVGVFYISCLWLVDIALAVALAVIGDLWFVALMANGCWLCGLWQIEQIP